MHLHRSLLALTAAVMFAGCPAKVATIELAPPALSFDSNATTKTIVATLKDGDGADIAEERAVTWTSKDPAVATVDKGVVKAVGSGATEVTVTAEEVSAVAKVDVVLLKRIQLQTPAMVLVAGSPAEKLALNFMNERGEPIDAAKAAKWKAAWKVTDAAVATVDDSGTLTAVAAGSTTLTVTVNEFTTEMKITVNPAPDAAPAPTPGEPVPAPKP
jgi:uncharacterized protein YjdB